MFLLKIRYIDPHLYKQYGQITEPYFTKWRPNSVLQHNESLSECIQYFRPTRSDKIYDKIPSGNCIVVCSRTSLWGISLVPGFHISVQMTKVNFLH